MAEWTHNDEVYVRFLLSEIYNALHDAIGAYPPREGWYSQSDKSAFLDAGTEFARFLHTGMHNPHVFERAQEMASHLAPRIKPPE